MVAFMEALVDSRKIWSGLILVDSVGLLSDQATSRQVFGSICYNSLLCIFQIISIAYRVKAA